MSIFNQAKQTQQLQNFKQSKKRISQIWQIKNSNNVSHPLKISLPLVCFAFVLTGWLASIQIYCLSFETIPGHSEAAWALCNASPALTSEHVGREKGLSGRGDAPRSRGGTDARVWLSGNHRTTIFWLKLPPPVVIQRLLVAAGRAASDTRSISTLNRIIRFICGKSEVFPSLSVASGWVHPVKLKVIRWRSDTSLLFKRSASVPVPSLTAAENTSQLRKRHLFFSRVERRRSSRGVICRSNDGGSAGVKLPHV